MSTTNGEGTLTPVEVKPKKLTIDELLTEIQKLPHAQLVERLKLLTPQEHTALFKLKAKPKCKEDLHFLTTQVLDYGFKDPCYYDLGKFYQRRNGRSKLVLWPRETGKTTFGTICRVIQDLLINPDERILILSDTEDISRQMLSVIKGHFIANKKLRLLFPEYCASDDYGTKTEFTLPNRTKVFMEPSIIAAGRETVLTSKHFTKIYIDDIVTESNAKSKELCDSVIEKFNNLTFLMSNPCELIVNGTRYSNYDLYEYILKEQKDSFDLEIQSIVKTDGTLLCPFWYPQERIEEKKRATTEYQFFCQMMNQPINPDTAIFNISNIKSISKDAFDQIITHKFITVDPAISQKKDADYTAIVTAGVDKDFNIYVLDIENAKLLPDQAINAIIAAFTRYSPFSVSIEGIAYQAALAQFLRKECKNRSIHIPINELKRDNSESKFQRICALQPKVKYGEFYIVEGCRNAQALKDQMAWYSQDYKGHDDMLDAVSDILRVAYRPSEGAQTKPIERNTGAYWDKVLEAVADHQSDDHLGNENISGSAINWEEILANVA